MTDIIFILLIVLVAVVSYCVIRSASKRIFLIRKLATLKKNAGSKIKYHTCPFFSFFRLSAKPEISVEIGDTVYLIRMIGASSKHRRVHFANPEFTVTIKGRRITSGVKASPGGTARMRFRRVAQHIPYDYNSSKSGKVRILPKLQMPDESLYLGKKVEPVLIFNPAPHDVTYVTPDKTKVIAAFTGDLVYDQRIFTASTFVTYAERTARQKRKESPDRDRFNFEYFS